MATTIKKRKTSWIDHRHPDYEGLFLRWDFLLEAYEGGQEYIQADWMRFKDEKPEANFIRHLHRHKREDSDDYRDRLTRAYYLNFTKPIIHIYRDHILRKGIETEYEDEKNKDQDWVEFEKDCTSTGMSLDYFMMKRAFPMVQVFGWQALLVDMEFFPEGIQTEKERKEKNARPFVLRIYPTDFLNWQIGNDGKFDWVYFRERTVQQWNDPTEIKGMRIEETFKVITRDEWAVYDGQGNAIKGDNGELKGTHKLGVVPITIAINEETEQYSFPIGMSAINDIADINKELYNLSSLEQEFLYKQCLAILAMDEELLGKIVEFGVGNALPIGEGQTPPSYISPPVDPAKYLSEKQKFLISEIFRHAVVRDTTATIGAAESGISKAYDFHHSNQNIASKAKSMEEAETEVKYYFYLWLNGGDVTKAKEAAGKVTRRYPQEFDVKTVNEQIEETISILKEDLGSRTMNQRLVQNNIVNRMFKDEKVKDQIIAEIEKVDPGLDHEERLQRIDGDIMSKVDEIMIQYPEMSPEEAEAKMEENIRINKKSMQGKMVNTNPIEGDQRKKIADQLKGKGINVKDEGTDNA